MIKSSQRSASASSIFQPPSTLQLTTIHVQPSTADLRSPSTADSSVASEMSPRQQDVAAKVGVRSVLHPRSRWLTPEYLIYYLILGFSYYCGTLLVIDASNNLAAQPGWTRGLEKGWIGGRMVDVRDSQFNFFRGQLPLLTLVAITYCVASYTIQRLAAGSSQQSQVTARLLYNFIFCTVFILYVNGSGIVYMYTIALINYLIPTVFRRSKVTPLLTWVWCTVILLLNERYHGYTFTLFLPNSSFGIWADSLYRGVNSGWYVLFNLTSLRMISFNMDYYWSRSQLAKSSATSAAIMTDAKGKAVTFESHAATCLQCTRAGNANNGACLWWREKQPQPDAAYNLLAYYAYLFYVPLHFAGPITTFNSWYSHMLHRQTTYTVRQTFIYVLRLVFCVLVLEVLLHYLYVFALTNSDIYKQFDVYTVSMTSYWTLKGIWLKFLVIWRFFRLWALCDGIETPENMNRCMSNHFSVMEFWRAWHRSFNRWLVRYIYVPLGGNRVGNVVNKSLSTKQLQADAQKLSNSVHDTASRQPTDEDTASQVEGAALLAETNGSHQAAASSPRSTSAVPYQWLLTILRRAFNIFVVFTFVAFWHDRELKLLAWGWLIALLFVPELLLRAVFASQAQVIVRMRSAWYYRHLKATAAAGCIWMMMVANLVGYSVGVNGTTHVVHTFFEQGGLKMCIITFAVFFSAAQLMFAVREDEARAAAELGVRANDE